MDNPELDSIVKDTWNGFSMGVQNIKIFLVMQKLKEVKKKIKEWNDKKRKKDHESRKDWQKRIKAIDLKIEEGAVSRDIIEERLEISKKLFMKEKQEKEDIVQKKQMVFGR
ncbi:hypothetical protein L1887_32119 [Cichorium endivia]|nr:hypothetical protein L1887_32119 [Cichorium endivia]